MEHHLLFLTGASFAWFHQNYETFTGVAQVLVLVIYLGLLVGIAPVPMPAFRSKFNQVFFAGIISSVLDSFIVLRQLRALSTNEPGITPTVKLKEQTQDVTGERAKLLTLGTFAALIGGLLIWFGEVYAAGLFNRDGRTGVLSALYVAPPVFLFLSVLGWHASRLRLEVVADEPRAMGRRNLVEFALGVGLLLLSHNPLLCTGVLLIYSVVTHQADQLFHAWKEETEINVILIILLAWVAGEPLVRECLTPLGLGTGKVMPIIPAAFQAVLWGPLYDDPAEHFWLRVTTLSTGAMLLPVSSLVGVMLFRTPGQWFQYMKYSIPYAFLWYVLMRCWIWLTLDGPIGQFLDHWARPAG